MGDHHDPDPSVGSIIGWWLLGALIIGTLIWLILMGNAA